MEKQTRILANSGSLSGESYNGTAQRGTGGLAPEDAAVETLELDGKALFNKDSFDICLLRCVFHLDGLTLFNHDEEKNLPRKKTGEGCSRP